MRRHSFAMHFPSLFSRMVLVLFLASCEKAVPPTVVQAPPAPLQNDAQLIAARDALSRQAVEIETRSALLDKQLAELEQKLRQSENDALRGRLDILKQQNEQLRAQADIARQQSDQLSRRLVTAKPKPLPVQSPQSPRRDYSLFYGRLAPHGRWIDVSGYGLCFQPGQARVTTWRPYVDGCWSWSTLGWAWQSNEPFGWATYHYGRWINLSRHGWLWVPGCEWAPAWVAWRQSRDYIGWAPLPPEPGPCISIQRDCDTRYNLGPASYTFISVTNFVRPSYTTICRPVSYNSTIFHHTVNSTQIVPCGGPAQGGTQLYMHHGGPLRYQIEQQCRQTIPQTQLRPIEHHQIAAGGLPGDSHKPGKPHLLPVIELPALTSRPALPDIKPAEHIERPQLADAFAGVPANARPAIQQTIEADRKRPLIADSPHPASPSPTQPASSTPQLTETIRVAQPGEAQNPPARPLEPVGSLNGLTSLGAPIETRGGQPDLNAPEAPSIPTSLPATLPATTVVEAPVAPAMPPVVETPAQTPPTTAEPTIAATPTSPEQAATAPMSQPPTQPAAPDPTAAVEQQARQEAEALAMQQKQAEQAAAEQQARQQAEALAMQQKQAEEAAARAAAEEQMRQAQMEAQRQAQMEAQRQAEEAQRQAQMEAQRQAQMEAQRQAEEAQRRAQEEAQRQAQMEAQRQAQMEAQRQAEEAARRAQEEAQRQAEAAARAAAESVARPNPPQ